MASINSEALPEFQEIPVHDLHFDDINPRFPSSINGQSIEQILDFMLADAGLVDLMRSIASQGFFPGEPLLVSPSLTGAGWTVVEGNRRLAATLLLLNPELAPIKRDAVVTVARFADRDALRTLPCLLFPERADILKHLGYRHVTGIKEWEPLAKARFLRQRFDDLDSGVALDERLKTIARTIGSRSDYVGRLLTALAVFDAAERASYFGIDGLNEQSLNFSLITSTLAYTAITEYLGLSSSSDFQATTMDGTRVEFLMRTLFERGDDGRTRLIESRNIGTLAKVVADDEALTALQNGSTLANAARIAGARAESFRSLVAAAGDSLDLASNQVKEFSPTPSDLDAAQNVLAMADHLVKAVQLRIAGA